MDNHQLIGQFSWPLNEVDAALAALAQHCFGALEQRVDFSPTPTDIDALDTWLTQNAHSLSLETQAVSLPYQNSRELLAKTAPAIIRIPSGEEIKLLLVVKQSRGQCDILTPALKRQKVKLSDLTALLTAPIEHPHLITINQLLNEVKIPDRRRKKAVKTLLSQRLKDKELTSIWLLRLPPSQPFWRQLKNQGIPLKLIGLTLAYTLQSFFFVLSWWLIGQAAFSGHVDMGWLWAWGLLLFSQVPLHLLISWLQANITIDTGQLVKKRLLLGSLMMDPTQLKKLGVGQLLSRVFDAETLESVTLSGGFIALLAVVELSVALVILSAGLVGYLHSLLLLLFLIVLAAFCRHQFRLHSKLTQHRLTMSHSLVEKMIGHRTRLAQQHPDKWHLEEDNELQHYVQLSTQVDKSTARLTDLLPRIWLLVAILAFIPAMIDSQAHNTAIAVSLGGVLYAYQAIIKMLDGFTNLTTAAIAWQQMKPIFQQTLTHAQASAPRVPLSAAEDHRSDTLIHMHNITFGYAANQKPVLENGDLSITKGDNILLQGESGSGKSTLASLITGIQQPSQGTLLLKGFDQASIGLKAWRSHLVLAPQFHENHVFSGPFAFNLLMGNQWPPTVQSMNRAHQLCLDLGLGPLLERMPGGIMQMVGETGWQLSHGEKSRLFLARAILQNAELVILDESFAALDPKNLKMALNCVKKEAKSLMIIAHP
ncbi:ABC transporter ATP-binding protein [Alteromonadaceae bacterium M269]|nr:ABC transporter ATP-binding protein [Alteromonadaceae bacterium M269]